MTTYESIATAHELLHAPLAVSYTHLDVYKRQDPGRAREFVAQLRRAQKRHLHLGVGNRNLAARPGPGDRRGAHGGIEHGRKKTSLDNARGVKESFVDAHGPDGGSRHGLVNARKSERKVAVRWDL